MLKGVENGISRVVAIAVTALLIFTCSFFGIQSLVGMNQTGMDVAVGEVMGKTASDAGDYAVPALKNMTGPAWEVGKTAAGEAIEGFKPSGESELFGSVTINWDEMFSGDGQITVNGEPYNGGNDSSNGNSNDAPPTATQAPVACDPETPQSRAALIAWVDGDWETAAAQFSLTNLQRDCLAEKLTVIFQPFDAAVRKMYGAESAAQFADAIKTIKAMNPQFTEVYAAEAMARTQGMFEREPLEFDAEIMAGAAIKVKTVEAKAWASGLIKSDKDVFTITIGFKDPWVVEFQLNRVGIEQLEAALGLDKGYFGEAGDSYTVPGLYIPEEMGNAILPSGVEYDPTSGLVTEESAPAPVTEEAPAAVEEDATPVPTATAAPPAAQDGTKVCTWPGIGSSGGQYMVAYLGVTQADIQRLNPGLWEAYASSPGESRQVTVPDSAGCQ